MVGIYKYAAGLVFIGVVAETEEDAKKYLYDNDCKGCFEIKPIEFYKTEEQQKKNPRFSFRPGPRVRPGAPKLQRAKALKKNSAVDC